MMLDKPEQYFQIAEMRRWLSSLYAIGKIAEISEDNLFYTVNLAADNEDEQLTGFIPRIHFKAKDDGHYNPLEVGEQVIVLNLTGDLGEGIILGAIPSSQAPGGPLKGLAAVALSDGGSVSYDKGSSTLDVSVPDSGNLTINVAGSGTISVSGGSITISGAKNVNISGKSNVSLEGQAIGLNSSGSAKEGVVTGECICAFTGSTHPQFSQSVTAGLTPKGGS